MLLHDRGCSRREFRLGLCRKAVQLLACRLATQAADALRKVDQDCFRFRHSILLVILAVQLRKNSLMILCRNSVGTLCSSPATGIPPSCASAGLSFATSALRRVWL